MPLAPGGEGFRDGFQREPFFRFKVYNKIIDNITCL